MRYAFLRFDAYPYITSGLIIRNHPTRVNTYQLEDYSGFWLEPAIVLHGEQGRLAHEELRRWRDEYRKTLRSVTGVYMDRLRDVATQHGLIDLVQRRLTEFNQDRDLQETKDIYGAATQT